MATNVEQLPKPTEAELELLHVLWDKGPSTVAEVHEKVGMAKDTGYTTTLKILQIMTGKGLVERRLTGKKHIYTAVISRELAQKKLLNRLLQTAFHGSSASLVMQALGGHAPGKQELSEIRTLLDKLDSETKKK